MHDLPKKALPKNRYFLGTSINGLLTAPGYAVLVVDRSNPPGVAGR
jgi:hypothetical protein